MKRARLTAGWLKQKPTSIALLLVMLVPVFGALFMLSPHASAAQNATWKDTKTITYNGVDYTSQGTKSLAYNTNPGKTYQVYASPLPAGGCISEIYFDQSTDVSTAKTAHFMAGVMGNGPSGSTGVCIGQTGSDISFSNTQATNTSTQASGGQVSGEDPCNVTGDPLSWFICPVINMINAAITLMQQIIDNLLEFDVKTVFDRSSASGQAYYTAWNSFRLVGIAVVVIAGLVMVITQALGLEVFDAYTVKKVVPRLFIAAIGISLSWYLLQFLANVTNDVGLAVRHMIYWPFRNIGDGNTGLTSASGFLAGDLLVGGVFLALGLAGTLSLVLTAGLAALVAFLVLILRQIVLILLILLAPLAIALYVLPNTQKAYQLWWDAISKGFMMFPIITAFIATGRVFSVVAANAGGDGIHHTVNEIISLIAFFLPYFALPFTFRLAGGAIGTIAGLTNDRSRGAFDRLKNYRGTKTADNLSKMRTGNRFRDNNVLTRGFNRSTRAIATAPSAGFAPSKMRSRYTGAAAQHTFDEAEELRSKNTDFMSGMQDDRMLRAILRGGHRGRAGLQAELRAQGMEGAELDTATGVAERMLSSGSTEAVMTAAAIHQASTGTGYADAGEMLDTIAAASGGNRVLGGKMLGSMRGLADRSGRQDLGSAGFGMMAGQLSRVYDHGAGSADVRAIQRDAFSSVDATSLARGRGESVRNLTEAATEYVNSAATPADERARYAAQLQNVVDNAREYGALARSHEAHEGGRDAVIPLAQETAQNNPEYQAHRSRYAQDEGGPNNPRNPNNRPPEET